MSSRSKAVFSYVGLYFSGILFLAAEKKDEFVRKSAAQSVVLSLTALLFRNFLVLIPIVGAGLTVLFDIIFVVVLVFLIVKAANSIYFKLPIIGEISENYVENWFK